MVLWQQPRAGICLVGGNNSGWTLEINDDKLFPYR